MPTVDYRGARGSNAGDDFHELWALRQALTLLEQGTRLIQVTVEGLASEDESGVTPDTWDGVDCTLYYRDNRSLVYEEIVLAQLKYSAANPDDKWTISRFTTSTSKSGNNSVIRKLAKAYDALAKKYPELATDRKISVKFISNQDIDLAVTKAISESGPEHESNRNLLQRATGLPKTGFETFIAAIDFSECGSISRFAQEERILTTISNWTENDARPDVNNLLMFIRRKMLPEAKEVITSQSILANLGISDLAALLPCHPSTKRVDKLISRQASSSVVEKIVGGTQKICLHGEGGCGKTTALQEIADLLPPGSIMLLFDCYGSGRYLDSDAHRHLPKDAFLQLSNELAVYLRTPLLISWSEHIDYAKAFKKRLEKAAEVLAAKNTNAILLVCIDAADNSITAANTHAPPERSFVHDFIRLGNLPSNIRFVVTCRSGRREELNLPREFMEIPIQGFSLDETTAYVRRVFPDAPDYWIDDFHALSSGNPRIEQYALELAGSEPERALECLRPNGKVLNQIFRERFEFALRLEGNELNLQVLCAGLIALPRPIPISALAKVTEFSEAHVRDICNDLAPGIRIAGQYLSFSDEDFENFVRIEGQTHLKTIYSRIADHFTSQHKTDPYAATHLAGALLAAHRGSEILNLINTDLIPKVIADPILRRETERQRLQIAMKVCREAGNNVDALLTLLIGAEALKTDDAITQMLIDNPDLAASFARDTSARTILRDPDKIEKHGSLLFHLMAVDARSKNAISVREEHRQLVAWLQARKDQQQIHKEKFPNSPPNYWSINDRDIAAETEAILRIQGSKYSLEGLKRWNPKSMVLHVASLLSFQLIISGESSLVESYITEAKVGTPWDLFLLVPLALSGKKVELSRLEVSLGKLLHRGLIRLGTSQHGLKDENPEIRYLDMIVTACELIIARGGNHASVIPVLEKISGRDVRRQSRHVVSESLITLSLRAHSLLERLAGRQATWESYWIDPDKPDGDLQPKDVKRAKERDNERRQQTQDLVKPIIDIYDVRARAILGLIKPEELESHLQTAITQLQGEYRFNRRPYEATIIRTQTAMSVARLLILPDFARTVLWVATNTLLGSNTGTLAKVHVYESFALDTSLHPEILKVVTTQAIAIRDMKTSAEDKISSLTDYARLILPISPFDAQILFNMAIEVAGGVNVDSVHEIALFSPLAKHAITQMSAEERRGAGGDLAIIVGDTAIRLANNDHFPWEKVAQAITTLDMSLALSVAARWEDLDIVRRWRFLPPVLETALLKHDMTPSQTSALSPLLDEFSSDLTNLIVDQAIKTNRAVNNFALVECLARDELLRFGKGTRPEVSEKISLLQKQNKPGFWMDKLTQTTTFLATTRETKVSVSEEKAKQSVALDSVNWASHRFVTPDEVIAVIKEIQEAAQAQNIYHISDSVIFDKIGNVIRFGDRVAHLDALIQLTSSDIPVYEISRVIAKRIAEWKDSLSVVEWSKTHIIQLVIDLLPELSIWLSNGENQLPDLLEQSGASDQEICETLLNAIECHVEALHAHTIYALIGLIGQYCAPADAAAVLLRYAKRLIARIPVAERDNWNLTDIPSTSTAGLARFLYAFMGDIDIRIRWRAAHALRRLVQLGDTDTLAEIVKLYDRRCDACYRNPSIPFYWISARLWLLIALDRIADEMPEVLKPYGQWLFGIATDKEFPHVVIRSFAKSATYKLVDNGCLVLSPIQIDTLDNANTGSVPRKKARRPSYNIGFDRYKAPTREDRFHFDSMDTLPYWYSSALRAFADVTPDEFLETAEYWIIDNWGVVQENVSHWVNEPRKYRISDSDSMLMSHNHGSRPILERFSTYLELHAMWCTIGELMQTRALTTSKQNEYDTFEYILKNEGLTIHPFWLADFHRAKPLETRMWLPPQADIDVWVDTKISDDEFLAEIGLPNNDGSIVVESSYDNRSSKFTSSTRVRTALVSPKTAGALVRALQSLDVPWGYYIPKEGDNAEIQSPPYKLVGWLTYTDESLGIDEHDPLRYDVNKIQVRPSIKTANALNLEFVHDGQTRWVETGTKNTILVYEAWGDTRGDQQEERIAYSESVRSGGWKLKIEREALLTLLNKFNLDLITEIEITRRNYNYGHSRYDEEKENENRFCRIILFRRDGTIEAAEGCLGAWATPRP